MSSKKSRGATVLIVPPDDTQNHSDVSTLSTIDKASFLEGLHKNYGNPLHSTAVEEDLNVLAEGQVDEGEPGRKEDPQTLRTTAKQRGAAVKRKQADMHGEIETEEEKRKRSRRSIKKKTDEPAPTANIRKQLVGKKPAKRRTAGQRPVKNKEMKTKKNELSSGKSSDSQSQEECEYGTAQQRRKIVLSSEEEVDEDTSWKPSPQKAKVYSLSRTRKSPFERSKSRKSSSGSASAEAQEPSISKHRKKRRGHQGRTDLEMALDAFLDFCDQYRESVGSQAVKQSIDSFSNNVKEQLLEKISSYKQLRVLKRENTKVGSLIHRKTQQLLDAKHELMRAERQVWLLQKEKAQLKLRLADLRQGHAFLHEIRKLNSQYLHYRETHSKEKEMYGVSSLPALLLETKHIQAAEHQLRGINNRLEKKLKNDGTWK